MGTDLTLASARSDRDALVNRTAVLDKVGVLRCLPDDMHATTPMLAEFYEVDREALLKVIQRNREELDSDGFRIIGRSEVVDILSMTPEELGMPRTAPSMSLFPRRAVLRIGMLLRDSPVARRVRDTLLDIEHADATVHFLIPKTLPDALRLAADEYERAEIAEQRSKALEARIEQDAPLVAKAEAHSHSDNAAVNRQTFAREVQQWGTKQGIEVLQEHVYELLRRKGMLIAGDRSDRNHATAQAVKAGWAWTQKEVKNGHATATTYLRAAGQDLAWKWITNHVDTHGDLRPRTVA
ncbi:phage antirepressor KilAC domain-containing protein [Mycobacteroides abscessus]|uniref:phage antirepressor KilAC domain-containing protein n=1 Tax=Mycobacteroides abscessus TaxID=36809 RepID=UPI00031634BF|nr:phage antirepressor KilAC domain-containing protein [Mycobacteroides abscessus]